jgi:asparagine N-glycosylation enzyme membrane subunit Stt3
MIASAIIGLYELTWIGRSSLAVVIMLLAFITAINSYAMARKEK